MTESNFLIDVLIWLPKIFFGIVFIIAAVLYSPRLRAAIYRILNISAKGGSASGGNYQLPKFINYKLLIICCLLFRVIYAFILTVSQYYIWGQAELTKLLLNSPLSAETPMPNFIRESFIFSNRLGYFLFYSWGRFWFNIVLSFVIAFIFYIFLKILKKYNERFFEEGEPELGFLAGLIVGWPNFVIFVPFIFIAVILVSIFRLIRLRELYTTLGWPIILATFLVLISDWVFNNKLLEILGLTVLKI